MLLGKYLVLAAAYVPRAVKEEVMWAFKSSTVASGIDHDILPEKGS